MSERDRNRKGNPSRSPTRVDRREGESIDSMLRKFKRKVKNDGTLQDLRDREHFEKPSERKKKDKRAAERRTYLQQKSDQLT